VNPGGFVTISKSIPPGSRKYTECFDYHPKRGITLEFLKVAGYNGLGSFALT